MHRSAPTDVPNNLKTAPLPPAPAVETEGVVSLEGMLRRGKLEYDFGITSVKPIERKSLRKGSIKDSIIREALSEYVELFTKLLADPGDSWLKLRFSVVRLKLNTFLVCCEIL